MFQNFSGSSRRPRQVNLSGQNTNPFGTQHAVAAAQHERQIRQQERDRLVASKKIQRVWRGHKVREGLAESLRTQWDASQAELPKQLMLLMTFFIPRRKDDIQRLENMASRIFHERSFLSRSDIQARLPRLATITLQALEGTPLSYQDASITCAHTLLGLLIAILDHQIAVFPRISQSYYDYLTKTLLPFTKEGSLGTDLVKLAIRAPLVEEHVEQNGQEEEIILEAYAVFALQFLTQPNPLGLHTTPLTSRSELLAHMSELASFVNFGRLSTALIRIFSGGNAGNRLPSDSKLRLLGHFIGLHRIQHGSSQEPEFLRALSLQLSSSSAEIIRRIDLTDSDVEDNNSMALDPIIKEELLSLVEKPNVTSLLDKFNVNIVVGPSSNEDASLLASYALTLLRIFPRRSDDIRMWLYPGSITTTSGQIPVVKFFWNAMSSTKTFSLIQADSKAALTLLQPVQSSSLVSPAVITRDREWRSILLFLELYSFVLRFTDDEEFLNGGVLGFGQHASTSRIRESALPLQDVKQLTLFLKNLAFTAYFNSAELSDDGQQTTDSTPSSYFGSATSSRTQSDIDSSGVVTYRPFAGIAGMNFSYVRTIVAGVMRSLYERDSRRRFLPKDHWLMTSRFDMEGFITAVVAEEERQHKMGDDEDEEDGHNYDFDPVSADREMALVGMSRPRRARQVEELRKQQQQVMRKRHMAQVGPRLEILQNMPFAIPFETRVQIFREFVYVDQVRRRGGNVDPDIWRMSMVQQAMFTHPGHHGGRPPGREVLSRHHAKIRRDQVFEDALEQFYELGEGLKEPIQITFVDKFNTVEAGIDGGGVTKEFLTSITNEAFRAESGPNLFMANDQNLLYPNPTKLDDCEEFMRQAGLTETDDAWKEARREILRQYEFLGRIVGKCLYEGILIDVGFAGFFLLKWAASGGESAYKPNVNDLRDLDEGLYQGLLKLKNYDGNVQDLSIDFTIDDTTTLPEDFTHTTTRELIPGGSTTPVTNENRPFYMLLVARHRLWVQPFFQTQAFLRGLGQIIKPSWLSMFNQSELQTLIGGDSSEIDVENLRSNTQYGGVYQIGDDRLEHPTIQLFWKVLKDLDDSERRKVLKYVTSTPRAPLLGFSQLNPPFSIRDAGNDEARLPSTSTCVNLLKLPRYSTAATLRSKLLYAVNSGAGFDLS